MILLEVSSSYVFSEEQVLQSHCHAGHQAWISKYIHVWAVAWDFQQCGILTCVDSDEPLQPPSKLRHSKWCSVSSLTITKIRILKRLAKALIRLRVCAGWSEALLVAHTKLLEISCTSSYMIYMNSSHKEGFKYPDGLIDMNRNLWNDLAQKPGLIIGPFQNRN